LLGVYALIMLERVKRLLPTKEGLDQNRWLRWLGPWLHHPRLWHMSRKGIAMGLALGVFFGLLIPVAQIPFAATMAVVLRANLPVAVASTLVTNPVTFGPVYYGAYRLGKFVLLEEEPSEEELEKILEKKVDDMKKADQFTLIERIQYGWHQLGRVGKPLIVGLAMVATMAGLIAYFLVHTLWMWRVRWERRRRLERIRHPR
jgi:uncharacterized protein